MNCLSMSLESSNRADRYGVSSLYSLCDDLTSTFPVVIYITGLDDMEELRSCEAIEDMFRGLNIMSQRKILSSDLLFGLLKLGFVRRPRVFFRGRYIGSLNKVLSIKGAADLATTPKVCAVCGNRKFIIPSTNNLMPCRLFGKRHIHQSSTFKLFICFQGTDSEQRHIYVICSLDALEPYQHTIAIEAVIHGYPFMGFGVYDSKIVLAGGLKKDNTTHNGCITFDMKSHVVDCNPFVLMSHGKFKPLLFQLGRRLYVCESRYDFTSLGADPVEMYSPAVKTKWHTMSIFNWFRGPWLANYSCLVLGNTCFMSAVPVTDDTWRTHSNYKQNYWVPYSDTPLPFTGVATFHSQEGFDDFLMIYFDKGAVRVCKFDLSGFGDSQVLFNAHQSDENMQGYFADFERGRFCLTTFDNLRVCVCTFVVTREGTPSGPLKVTHSIESDYFFHYDKLFTDGMKITSVVGCSAAFCRNQNGEVKSRVAKAEAIFYKHHRKIKDDYDPVELEILLNYESLFLEDVEGWSGETYSEREENSGSNSQCEEDLACDDKSVARLSI